MDEDEMSGEVGESGNGDNETGGEGGNGIEDGGD